MHIILFIYAFATHIQAIEIVHKKNCLTPSVHVGYKKNDTCIHIEYKLLAINLKLSHIIEDEITIMRKRDQLLTLTIARHRVSERRQRIPWLERIW